MRVALVVGSLHRGGGCRLLAELANGLVRRGRRVFVAVPEGKAVAYPLQAEVVRVGAPEAGGPGLPAADVAITNFYTTVAPALTAYGPQRTLRLSLGFEPLWTADWEAAAQTYRPDVRTIAISSWLASLIRDATGVEVAGIVHPGVDHRVFRPGPSDDPGRRPGRRVFYVGRAVSQGYAFKGGSDFWQAVALVRRRMPDLEVEVAATDGVLDDAPDGAFRVLEDLDDAALAEAYRRADVFVSSSWFEGFGLPALEAMASGTPVVATDSGGIRDLVAGGAAALVVPARNPTALALAIQRVLSDPDVHSRLARAGVAVAQAFSWERLAAEVDAHVEAMVAAHGRAR